MVRYCSGGTDQVSIGFAIGDKKKRLFIQKIIFRIEGTKHGSLIADQMLDVAIRVQSIRPFAVSQVKIYS
jgi:hypothetical protein